MIIQALTNSFKAEILQGVHDLDTDTLKLALYTGSASLNPTTTVYTTTDEVVASGYSAGGVILTGVTISTSTASMVQPSIVYVDFNDALFTAALTARGGLIYNFSKSNKSIAVLDFGSDKTSTATFTVQMPPNTSTAALLRFN
jgi:hypothetical protein